MTKKNFLVVVVILALLLSSPTFVFGEDDLSDDYDFDGANVVVDSSSLFVNNFPAATTAYQKHHRDLQCDTVAAYHPDYTSGWNQGKCDLTTTCNSPSYTTQLACCQGAFAGQEPNYCISQLAAPPTASPTKMVGPDIYYPDYSLAWTEGKCINTLPMPNGRPAYTTMLACCKTAYVGQTSNACIKALPNPPTSSRTKVRRVG